MNNDNIQLILGLMVIRACEVRPTTSQAICINLKSSSAFHDIYTVAVRTSIEDQRYLFDIYI